MNSMASRVVAMPPMAMTGIDTAPAISQTMRSAIGRSAGPLKPPVRLCRRSFLCSTSIDMPRMVLMAVIASAPACSQARATAAMSPASGLILTQTGKRVAARTARVTSAQSRASLPNSMPPSVTFGHDTLSSTAKMPSSRSRRSAIATKSSTLLAKMLATTPTCAAAESAACRGRRPRRRRSRGRSRSACRPAFRRCAREGCRVAASG